ncbi:hypothetical protein L2Y94_06500 [Luteibacter aegosomatis]|uniref:hypothetical protein n=1 Tax=Luteibacter aegosomatis TaxID=2911537 RepID=UPI001FFA8B2E|nr:hypothetical protein [Luteibacter aegosomatis]UPG87001.1 hypothetical protein L2Y94_06500 [Luteibacter aegosomatis]
MSKGQAIITVSSDGDNVSFVCDYLPATSPDGPSIKAHELAALAILTIHRALKEVQDHVIHLG